MCVFEGGPEHGRVGLTINTEHHPRMPEYLVLDGHRDVTVKTDGVKFAGNGRQLYSTRSVRPGTRLTHGGALTAGKRREPGSAKFHRICLRFVLLTALCAGSAGMRDTTTGPPLGLALPPTRCAYATVGTETLAGR